MAEERRVVTVLFTGIVGIGDVSSPDPEDAAESAAEVVDAVFTRFRRVIEARGGTVDKFVGDTVMGVFGAPTAHEDDPLRAVRAALSMKRELELFNAQRSLDLKIRVGVNTGEVLWGTVGGDRPTAMGDAVNVAQRLQSEAQPGEVLASRAVARATNYRVEFGPEREMHLRGRQDSVGVSEAIRETGTIVPSTGDVGPARLIGRVTELQRIKDAVTGAKSAFLLLEGDSGVGKTRLTGEARDHARRVNPETWIGLGHAQEGSPLPLGPFAEIVRSACRAASQSPGGDAAAEAASTRAFVSEVLALTVSGAAERSNFAHLMTRSMGQAAGTGPAPGDATRARTETLEAWERWIRGLARRAPVLLCLEDLHWADPATFALLDHLAAKLRDERVVILATSRPATRIPGGFERVKLVELPAAEAAQLARELLQRDLDPELSSFLVDQSAGNPLYMEELVRFLRQEGFLEGNPARFATRPDRLPDGLRGLLVSRIDAVSADAREALKCGSIFGRAFWSAATGTLAGHDVGPALEQAGRRMLVERAGSSFLPLDEEFHFRQSPLRDAAYSLLTKKERQRLHGRAAEILEPLIPHLGRRVLILLAGHCEAALRLEAASKHWARAAEEALEFSAYEEALASAREAQRIDGSPEAALSAIKALNILGLGEQALAEAESLLESTNLTEVLRFRVRRQIGAIHERRGEFARALEIDEAILADPKAAFLHTHVLRDRSHLFYRLSRFDECLRDAAELQKRAQAQADAGGGRAAKIDLANAISTEARVRDRKSETTFAAEAYRRAQALYAEAEDVHGAANVRNGLGILFMHQNRLPEARVEYEAALEVFREAGDRWRIAMVLTNMASVEFQDGHPDKAFATTEEALAIRRDIADKWGEAMLLSNEGMFRCKLGQARQACDVLERALELRRATGDRLGVSVILERLAEARLDRGEAALARAAAEESIAIQIEIKMAGTGGLRRQLLGETLAFEGRLDEAIALLAPLAAADDDIAAALASIRLDTEGARALAASKSASARFRALTVRARVAAKARASDAPALLEQARAAKPAQMALRLTLEFLLAEAEVKAASGDGAGAKKAALEGDRLAASEGAAGRKVAFGPYLH
ncbi:MAG: adenylate/guanylate cyclase domain-containing protein [Planctomycetota bacterium]